MIIEGKKLALTLGAFGIYKEFINAKLISLRLGKATEKFLAEPLIGSIAQQLPNTKVELEEALAEVDQMITACIYNIAK